jgi:hypothetical protein
MKLVFLPTLADMRDMLGDRLYVEMVWMWRERDQQAHAEERRAKWAAALPARQTQVWPKPVFARAESPKPVAADAPGVETLAMLHANVAPTAEPRTGDDLKSFLSQIQDVQVDRKERVKAVASRRGG